MPADNEMPEWVAEEIHSAKAQALRSLGRVYHDGPAAIVWLADALDETRRLLECVERERDAMESLMVEAKNERAESLGALDRAQRERDEARIMAGGVEYENRSWALSVLLARIDAEELKRIGRQLEVPEIDRFIAVVDGYSDQLARASHTPPEGKND